MTEALAQCGAPFWVENIEFDRIEARGNRRGLSQGCREVLGEQPRPGRGDGPIDRCKQAALALPGEAAGSVIGGRDG